MYQGFARFYTEGPSTGPIVVLATGASVNLVLEPIFSNSVWGAGWWNAAETAHYADNVIRYEGNIDTELQYGASGGFWNFLADFAVAKRAYPRSLEISPDGAHVYKYLTTAAYDATYDTNGAWCSRLSMNTGEGQVVNTSISVVAIFRTETDPAGGTNFGDYTYISQRTGVVASSCSVFSPTNPLNSDGLSFNPIPYWRTNAQLATGTYAMFTDPASLVLPQAGTETVDWSVEIGNNHKILYTCSGSRLPRAVLMGPMSASGNVTLYHTDGVFDPILGPSNTGTITSPYLYAANTWFQISIPTPEGNHSFIELPAVVIETDDYSIKGAGDVTNRAFSLKAMGGRCDNTYGVLPPCIISAYNSTALPS